jgi:hypothetical protein
MKTLIVFAIFGALMFLYIVYMSGEFSKSAKKLEAFEEAASSLKSEQTKTPTGAPTGAPTGSTSTTNAPSTTTTTTTAAPTATTTPSATSSTTTSAPTTTKKTKPVKDLEKTLIIVNAYEEIYGTKIGPDELEELNSMFAEVEDRDVIIYKLKELRSQSTEVDAIFELVDISNKLGSIVNRLKARAGARAEVQVSSELVSKGANVNATTTTSFAPTSGSTSTPQSLGTTTTTTTNTPTSTSSTVEGYRPLPKYLSF